MASIRTRQRANGTTAHCVLFRHDGQQSTLTFEGGKAADAFPAAVEAHGVALETTGGRSVEGSARTIIDDCVARTAQR